MASLQNSRIGAPLAVRRPGSPLAGGMAAVLVTALVVGLCGCAGGPRGGPGEAAVPPGGYAAASSGPVLTTAHDWLIDNRAVGLLLSEPAAPQLLPVVVYVPGLGESNGAGDRWRSAWSAAGYAVVSVQPLGADANAWTSELARSGDFKALGRERYGAEATRQRVALLRAVLAEAKRRGQRHEAAWDRIDWSRAAIAGFDLGAYSALALLRQGATADAAQEPVRFGAALLISPYTSVPRLAAEAQASIGDVPLLAIGGDADGDPLGLVDPGAPADRFLDRFAGADRFVLWMAGLTHANLSGSAALDRAAAERKTPAAASGGGGRRGRKGSASASGSKQADAGRAEDGEAEPTPDLPLAEARTRTLEAAQLSTAFLDASLKGDARARAWLATSAQTWLGAAGELRRMPAEPPRR